MSLGKKTVALFLVLGICFCLGSYAVLKSTAFPIFEEFERESSEEALMRVTRMLDSDLRALEIMNVEYSAWDQTYEFVQGELPEYADDNLDPAYWHSVNINLMMIFDAEGNQLYATISSPTDGTELSLQDELQLTLGPGHPLITYESTSDFLKGLLNMRSGIMQVVSYPILTSEAQGPIAGALVVGQYLSAERVQDLGVRATTGLSITTIGGADAPTELIQRVLTSEGGIHTEFDDDWARGYQILPDVFGAPLAVVEVTAPRRIALIGQKMIQTTMVALAFGTVVFLLAALLFLYRLITAPIRRLTDQVLGIRESGDLQIDVGTNRSDEVGVLAEEFGQLTQGLNNTKTALETALVEALAMSKAKSEFLARMSHEIRTPMNGVLGMTELLRETSLDGRQRRFAKTIYESGESLLHIINDILDISKIEAGKIELDIAPFNLRNLVEECLELLAESAHGKGLELACAIPLDANVHVRGDPVRLRQILMNLIGNALKFTAQGQVVVRVTEQHGDAGMANYRFDVEDTGIGIGPENLARIFEPFSQEDGSTTRRYGGTGLGLPISKQLAELMGGELRVDSAKGQGSTFWFTAELAVDQVSAEHPQPNLLSGKAVLVVDDNETNRDILRYQLEGWNMRVDAACSGSEALTLLRGKVGDRPQFDIILLDLAMPEMDGLQLAQAIREEHLYGRTPIIILSSISRADTNYEQTAAGPDDWLAKPVRQARLSDALLSLLSRNEIEPNVEAGMTTDTAQPARAKSGLRVLLVDDNEINRVVAKEMLESIGYQITIATNGREAVSACDKQVFDIVLMDCQMPEMDGYEATQKIRECESQRGRRPMPIVALTAHALQGDRERCLAAGMSDYLTKPFTRQQLSSVLSDNTQVDISTTVDNTDGTSAISPVAVVENKLESKGRILVADDNDINLQVTQAVLHSIGYESEVARDGNEALAAMVRDQFDLILMDCHMPVRDGYDTAKEVRLHEEQSSQSRRIPIVALTADFLESNRQRCLDAGMDDYVTKPFTQEQMRVVLNRWLNNAEAEDAAPASTDTVGFIELGETTALASIDRDVFDEIRQLDSTPGAVVLREIVVSYCASSTKLMLQLRSAVADHDKELVGNLAHSLKGGSGQMGATLLAALCEDMISSVREDDPQKLIAKFERAAIEHCAVLAGLDKELQSAAA